MKIGQKVVCKNDPYHAARMCGLKCVIVPEVGKIYKIREVELDRYFGSANVFILLEEVVNKTVTDKNGVSCEPSFHSSYFRPVDESFGEQVAEKLEVFFVPLEAAYKEQQHEN